MEEEPVLNETVRSTREAFGENCLNLRSRQQRAGGRDLSFLEQLVLIRLSVTKYLGIQNDEVMCEREHSGRSPFDSLEPIYMFERVEANEAYRLILRS